MAPLRIGFVPEHFSTPLHFAKTFFSLSADLIPFPSGTGHMVNSLKAGEIDVAIGLTEGWVAALATQSQSPNQSNKENNFKIVGTYVESPLCWAISTGSNRSDITSVADLRGKKLGVSRVGSGSYVMGFVLADRERWLSSSSTTSTPSDPPFEVMPLQNFESLRRGVSDGTADFFLWEYFTSKRYYSPDASPHPIKQIGEIYSPWSSWKIVARTPLIGQAELEELLEKLNLGIRYFGEHGDEAVKYISTQLDYEEEDAKEWLKTVRFSVDVRGVKKVVVEKTVEVLEKAGVVTRNQAENVEGMIGIMRRE
ncbi:MAG: hypothetical protein Q9201_007014 [Fulgogasparrea decipioides]